MLVWKIITYLFPFIKEMVLGNKTVQEALVTNKLKVALIGLILLSIGLNCLLVPRLFALSFEHVELKRKYAELSAAQAAQPPPVAVDPPAELPPLPTPALTADQQRLKEFFDRLRDEEKSSRH